MEGKEKQEREKKERKTKWVMEVKDNQEITIVRQN